MLFLAFKAFICYH